MFVEDVFGEDVVVQELQQRVVDMLIGDTGSDDVSKDYDALFVPSSTMANLIATIVHCGNSTVTTFSSPSIIVGSYAHVSLWEQGNTAGVAGVYAHHINEDTTTACMSLQEVEAALRRTTPTINSNGSSELDDHYPCTRAVLIENTHNALGGVALPLDYTVYNHYERGRTDIRM